MPSRERMLAALTALRVGDALGEAFFGPPEQVTPRIARRELPPGPCRWTDDTLMATAVAAHLDRFGLVVADRLVDLFASTFAWDRGYGHGTRDLLLAVQDGVPWRPLVREAFGGAGSWGNGAAMRAAPVGGWCAGDQRSAAALARDQAATTHGHPDAAEAAVAVAVAAADPGSGTAWLRHLAGVCRPGPTRDRLLVAADHPFDDEGRASAPQVLGTGRDTAGWDTVPFALWVVAHCGGDFEETFWATVAGLGDRDTTCAVSCGVVGAWGAAVPARMLAVVEPAPDWSP